MIMESFRKFCTSLFRNEEREKHQHELEDKMNTALDELDHLTKTQKERRTRPSVSNLIEEIRQAKHDGKAAMGHEG